MITIAISTSTYTNSNIKDKCPKFKEDKAKKEDKKKDEWLYSRMIFVYTL